MKKMRILAVLCAAAAASACGTAPLAPSGSRGQDLSGEWILTTTSQMGANDAEMNLRQTGNVLSGTISNQRGSVDLSGSVAGEAVEFEILLPMQGTQLQIEYSGVVQGDAMTGVAVFGAFGEGTFTARRKGDEQESR